MGTDVKIGLAVGLVLLLVVVAYFGVRGGDQDGMSEAEMAVSDGGSEPVVAKVELKSGQVETPQPEPAPKPEVETRIEDRPVLKRPPTLVPPLVPEESKPRPISPLPLAKPSETPVEPVGEKPSQRPSVVRPPVIPVALSPSKSKTSSSESRIYVVQPGDGGFWTVAEKMYGSGKYMNLIRDANPKADPYKLRAGQKLVVPPLPKTQMIDSRSPVGTGEQDVYVVQEGDRGFWGIAQKVYGHGKYWTRIKQANPDLDSDALQVGKKLVVPRLTGHRTNDPKPAVVVKPPKPVSGAAGGTYKVQAGDKGFWGIAEKVYGDGKYYRLIEAANAGVDADEIAIGQVLVIPPLSEASSLAAEKQAPEEVSGDDGRPVFD